ncbi:TIGR01841 family phasin [Magnetococcus sp. PR-3]|uniref:TIGR01841 family phasin n=1 Tax=Magnetococcus sp. PR-3 TaxID=3120355 RepID=UPI002FCE2F54
MTENIFFQSFSDITSAAQGNLAAYNKINQETFSKLAEQQVSFVTTVIENGVAQAKLLGETKDGRELVAKSTELTKAFADESLKVATTSFEIVKSAQADTTELVKKQFEEATAAAK